MARERKYHYEDRYGDLRGKIEDLMDEVKAKFPDAHADLEEDFTDATDALDRVQDILYEMDHGAYDDE